MLHIKGNMLHLICQQLIKRIFFFHKPAFIKSFLWFQVMDHDRIVNDEEVSKTKTDIIGSMNYLIIEEH